MKLTILLLTHDRPTLFTRAINAIIPQINDDIEVIVNNDSNDIVEVIHPNITYHYNDYDNLSDVYKFLLGESTGDYIYFAEDDDYVTDSFIDNIWDSLNGYGLIIGNYNPTYNPPFKLDAMQYTSRGEMDEFLLQLSQHIFKRSVVSDFDFQKNSDIHNDILMVKHAMKHTNDIKLIDSVLFYQTSDGGDNVSFPDFAQEVSLDVPAMPDYKKQYRIADNEYTEGMYGRSDTFRLHWDIITICDMNCPYCYARKQLEWNKIQNVEKIDEIISKLKKVEEPLEIVLLGGEPSLSPNYFYILDELEKIALSTSCISNAGGRVNKEWIRKHEKYKSFYFNFTYHPTETDMDIFKENVLEANKYNLMVNVMLLGPKYNTQIIEILDFCKEHNVGFAANIPFDPSGLDSYMLKNDKYKEWIKGIRPYFKGYLYFDKENETRTLHDIDVYLEDLNRFKGWKCLNNNYCVDGTSTTEITRMCDRTQTEKYMTCTLDACTCQGLMSNEKIR